MQPPAVIFAVSTLRRLLPIELALPRSTPLVAACKPHVLAPPVLATTAAEQVHLAACVYAVCDAVHVNRRDWFFLAHAWRWESGLAFVWMTLTRDTDFVEPATEI